MPTKSPRTRAGRAATPQTTPEGERGNVAKKPAAVAGDGPRTATVDLPFVTAQFRAPQIHLPRVSIPSPPIGRHEVAAAAQVARSYLPPPRQVAYYGGLTLMAALGVLEWPVAAAIGVGTAVMGWHRDSGHREEQKPAARSGRSPESTTRR
jgi:hypothetical protein